MKIERVLILDASAFIVGFDPLSVEEKQFTVPKVVNELVSNSIPWIRLNTAVRNKRLVVKTPRISSVKKAEEASKKVGDLRYLSEADMHILALALELKSASLDPVIVTDDYSIQNVANKIGVTFTSLMTYGIRFRFDWILYCPACHRKYPSDSLVLSCEICGMELRRKPLKKNPLI